MKKEEIRKDVNLAEEKSLPFPPSEGKDDVRSQAGGTESISKNALSLNNSVR